jgi:phenylacetate-CoA ligase
MATNAFPERAIIQRGQLEQLRTLLAAIVPANPFYTRKLAAAKVGLEIISLADFTRRFPFTTKGELVADQQLHPPYGTNLTYPREQYTRCHQTSGTAGAPLRWLDTPASWDWMVANWTEVFRAAGVAPPDRILFAFSFGPFIGFWMAFEAAARLGCFCLAGGGMSSLARLQAILEHQITVLCCTPTYALRLAEVAAEEKLDLADARIRTLIVAGEPGGSLPATRQRLGLLWPGARVFDHHGMTEVGPVTHECPARPGVLHVLESAYLPEIIDSVSEQVVAPGQAGELVLTTLGRTGSPLLRYRTGDLVMTAAPSFSPGNPEPCLCGRSDLALAGGILGRADDMVIVRGVNIFPSAVEEIVRRCGGVAEYQAHVTTGRALAELELRIEPYADCQDGEELARRLEKELETAFALRVPVMAVERGALPRYELKARRWIKGPVGP